jgi:hypothetical protein
VLEQGHPIANVKMCTRKLHSPLTAGERLPPGVCDRQPHQAERPTARLHGLRIRRRKAGAQDSGEQPDREPVRPQCPLGAPVRTAGQNFERAALFAAEAAAWCGHRRCTPSASPAAAAPSCIAEIPNARAELFLPKSFHHADDL